MVERSRRSVLACLSTCPLVAVAGCGDGPATETPTEPDAPTLETRIELVLPSTANVDEKPVQPLRSGDLPANEREILRTAREEGEYSVEYERHEGIPEDEAALGSLIDRILDRLESQKDAYRETHDVDVPDYVDAVYLATDERIYCIYLHDGDKMYYQC